MNTISNTDFIVAWLSSQTHQEVADKLKLPFIQVGHKAAYLKRQGVKLPKMRTGPNTGCRSRVDAEALNAMIAHHRGGK